MERENLTILQGREGTDKKLELLLSTQLHAGDPIPDVIYTLTRNGIGFAPLGGLCVVTGEAKHGKTWLLLQIASAFMSSQPKFGMERNADLAPTLLWFDTEELKSDTMRNLKRVHSLLGWSYDDDNPNLKVFNSRSLPFDQRREIISTAIEEYRPSVVIVDGIRDLMADFNDLSETADIINEFLAIADKYNCCIWTVLHVNPSSEKMRGHLGTELTNKANDIILMKREGEGENTCYNVKEIASRGHRDIDKWSFAIQDATEHGYAIPYILGDDATKERNEKRMNELALIIQPHIPSQGGISYTALRSAIKDGEKVGTKKAEGIIHEARKLGVLKEDLGKLRLNIDVKKDYSESDEKLPF